jgi:flagellar L-ring protein FlgH
MTQAKLIPALSAVVVLLSSLSGCSAFGGSREDDAQTQLPADAATAPNVANGAIYQPGYDIPLFENTSARRVGDVLVIRLVENTSASKSSSTSTRKSTSAELPGPTIGGRPVTVSGTPILEASIGNESSFDGEGSSSQSNRLNGDIAVTVVARQGNGILRVRGEKWVTINQGREFVRVEGLVRAIDVLPDNTVPSTRVANATISYSGKGSLADANAPGWLARFFSSPKLPF